MKPPKFESPTTSNGRNEVRNGPCQAQATEVPVFGVDRADRVARDAVQRVERTADDDTVRAVVRREYRVHRAVRDGRPARLEGAAPRVERAAVVPRSGERAAQVQMAVREVDRAHLAVQARDPKRRVERAGAGVDGRGLLAGRVADLAEAAAEVHVVAVDVDRAHEAVDVRVPRQERAGRQVDRRRVVSRDLARSGGSTRGAQRRELPADVGGGAADRNGGDTAVRLPRRRRRRADDRGLCGCGQRRPRGDGKRRLQQGRPTHSHAS